MNTRACAVTLDVFYTYTSPKMCLRSMKMHIFTHALLFSLSFPPEPSGTSITPLDIQHQIIVYCMTSTHECILYLRQGPKRNKHETTTSSVKRHPS